MIKLFVGNLPFVTTDQQLQEMFAAFGQVTSASVVKDRYSGRSRGFGFVEMETEAEAQAAIEKLNNSQLEGRTIVVAVARPKEEDGQPQEEAPVQEAPVEEVPNTSGE